MQKAVRRVNVRALRCRAKGEQRRRRKRTRTCTPCISRKATASRVDTDGSANSSGASGLASMKRSRRPAESPPRTQIDHCLCCKVSETGSGNVQDSVVETEDDRMGRGDLQEHAVCEGAEEARPEALSVHLEEHLWDKVHEARPVRTPTRRAQLHRVALPSARNQSRPVPSQSARCSPVYSTRRRIELKRMC